MIKSDILNYLPFIKIFFSPQLLFLSNHLFEFSSILLYFEKSESFYIVISLLSKFASSEVFLYFGILIIFLLIKIINLLYKFWLILIKLISFEKIIN